MQELGSQPAREKFDEKSAQKSVIALGLALTRAQAFLAPDVLVVIWIARSTTRTRSGCTPCSRSRDSLLRQEASRRYPIRR
jgi:hypothetical protein